MRDKTSSTAVEGDEAVEDAQDGCEATEKRGRERKGRQTVEVGRSLESSSLALGVRGLLPTTTWTYSGEKYLPTSTCLLYVRPRQVPSRGGGPADYVVVLWENPHGQKKRRREKKWGGAAVASLDPTDSTHRTGQDAPRFHGFERGTPFPNRKGSSVMQLGLH